MRSTQNRPVRYNHNHFFDQSFSEKWIPVDELPAAGLVPALFDRRHLHPGREGRSSRPRQAYTIVLADRALIGLSVTGRTMAFIDPLVEFFGATGPAAFFWFKSEGARLQKAACTR